MARPKHPIVRWLTPRLGHPLEAGFVHLLFRVFGAMSVDRASALGGWIGRTIGPRLPAHRTARRNLETAFPEKTPEEIAAILTGMWDNLGRTFAEYPHLATLAEHEGPNPRTEFLGLSEIDAMMTDGMAGILVSGHLANWEVQSAAARRHGLEMALVYRAPNNPLVDSLLKKAREPATSTHFPKGPEGARLLIRHLSKGGHVGMLIDQKMNDGIPVPFFGRDAMTAPAAAQLAMRYRIPLRPARMERLGGARFRLTIFPPVAFPDTGDRNEDARLLMTDLNALLESWIRERPDQWLWIHRRWPG